MVICIAILMAAVLAEPASAVAAQRITASPKTVSRTAVQTVQGRGWPVIEFCSRTIRAYVKEPQEALQTLFLLS
jgi:hypothetical protein